VQGNKKVPSEKSNLGKYLHILKKSVRLFDLEKNCQKTKTKTMTYSSSVALSRRTYGRRNQNTVAFSARAHTLGPISNTIILIVLACLIGLLYLTQVTKTNGFGYTINNLQAQQTHLRDQQADLQVSAARLKSLDRVASSNAAKSLVATAPSGVVKP
jgi:hypothetical protein